MIRKSFKPGEITPEDANRIVYDLAMEFTKGKHQFIVATHTDKAHIHNHVIFNSTSLDCNRKFSEPHQSGREVVRISDRLCREHGLSVVEHPRQKGMAYKEWDAQRKGQSWKGILQETIDRILPDSSNFDDFLTRMRAEGYEIKAGKIFLSRLRGKNVSHVQKQSAQTIHWRLQRNTLPTMSNLLWRKQADQPPTDRR